MVSGNIKLGIDQSKERDYLKKLILDSNNKVVTSNSLQTKDVYKELRLRGYHYGGLFQGIHEADLQGILDSLT